MLKGKRKELEPIVAAGYVWRSDRDDDPEVA